MSNTIDKERTTRRGFLRRAALVGGVATAAAVSRGAAAATGGQPDSDQATKPAATGYRETEHVRTYYRRARF